jgi:DUF1365 family protein
MRGLTVQATQQPVNRSNSLHSAIYEGTVRHRRFFPKAHAFTYRVFMVYLDLQEIETVFEQTCWWSSKGFSLSWFRRKDFFDGASTGDLYSAVANYVERETGKRPNGAIRMLTNLRYFGFLINPITCYYCFDKTGEKLEMVVAEVTNTPWGQRRHYILPMQADSVANKTSNSDLDVMLESSFNNFLNSSQDQSINTAANDETGADDDQQLGGEIADVIHGGADGEVAGDSSVMKAAPVLFDKTMHVSPFQPMNLVYSWLGKAPSEKLSIHLDIFSDEKTPQEQEADVKVSPVMDATLLLNRHPMTKAIMNKKIMQYPLMTVKVFAAIYWQAIQLFLKKMPFYSAPQHKPAKYN